MEVDDFEVPRSRAQEHVDLMGKDWVGTWRPRSSEASFVSSILLDPRSTNRPLCTKPGRLSR